MAIRDSQDVTLWIQTPPVSNIRDSQDASLWLQKPPVSNLRDSQDASLWIQTPPVSNLRDSQDITLTVESIISHVRDSQDVTLTVFHSIAPTTLIFFDDEGQFTPLYSSQEAMSSACRDESVFWPIPGQKNKFIVSFVVT